MVMQCDLKNRKQQGFTLVEMMISIVVAMTILAGLMLTFVNQSGQYKYQNKRIDTAQDLEFGIKFIEEDLRSALIGATVAGPSVTITPPAGGSLVTPSLAFDVWDTTCGTCAANAVNGRVSRLYRYDAPTRSLKYDRETVGGVVLSEILPQVTFFKVFDDYTSATDGSRVGYSNIPSALPRINVPGPAGTPVLTSGYTILIEVAVGTGLKGASPVDVRSNPVPDKRIWRYMQVYPMAAVP